MAKYIFSPSQTSQATAKVIIAADTNSIPENFLTSEETKAIKAAAEEHTSSNSENNFFEIFNGKTKVIFITCGSAATAFDIQIIGGKLFKKLSDTPSAAVFISNSLKTSLSATEIVCNLALGIELGGYRFDKYFTQKPADSYPRLETVEFFASQPLSSEQWTQYQAVATAVRYARDLCNEPANVLTPATFAEDIRRLEYLGLKITILEEEQIKRQNMKMLLSVAQGSANPPRVAVLEWPGNPKEQKISYGLVGKGVTFDSGGISLKPSANMGDMKGDMTGAAVVVSTLKAAALQKLPQNIVGIVGLVENMPSGSASRPGDIVQSMSGQTVEIVNTDAEGRLVLGDCLWYLQTHYSPDKIVDIATLTGSTMMTFGFEYAGLFSNDDHLADSLLKCGEISGEKLWRLPVNQDYNKLIDSDVADMKNTGPRLAGGITAACFLQRFIQPGKSWAHLDIAGVDRDDKGHPLTPKGATAFGVRLLNQLIKSN